MKSNIMDETLCIQQLSLKHISSKVICLLFVCLFLAPANGLSAFDSSEEDSLNFGYLYEPYISPNNKSNDENSSDVCTSEYCIQAAKELSQSIDETVDPCGNFYQFTCGKWMKNITLQYTYLPEIHSTRQKIQEKLNNDILDLLSTPASNGTVEPKAITNARRLYDACTHEILHETRDVFELLSLMDKEFGGWPTWKDSAWDKSKFNLSELLMKLNHYNIYPFYNVETQIEYDYLRLSERSNQSNRNNIYDDKNHSTINKTQFTKPFKYITLKLSPGLYSQKDTTYITNMDLYNFENKMIQYLRNSSLEASDTKITTTLKYLSEKINVYFDFGTYIRRLYLLANVTLSDDDVVVVENIESFRKISTLISEQSYDTLQEYLMQRFLVSLELDITSFVKMIKDYPKTHYIYYSTKSGARAVCAKWVNKNMGLAVAKLFIDKYYDNDTHVEATKMFKNIQETFIDRINQSTWMDAQSKKTSIEKTQAMMKYFGYPEDLYNNNMTKLEKIYADYNFTSLYMHNVLLLFQLKAKEYFQKLREPNGIDEWFETELLGLDAAYSQSFNKIVFPVAYLQLPFFHKDVPKYLNYGSSGTILGHEIGHGFDEENRLVDKNLKRYITWWSTNNDKFVERLNCIYEQYKEYMASQLYVYSQEDLLNTRSENIADNYGLQMAFYAYQNWVKEQNITEKKLPSLTKYTPEQLFFINYGYQRCSKMNYRATNLFLTINEHALPEFRINGPTSNFVEFDRAFQCKPGQRNSRVKKCSVW